MLIKTKFGRITIDTESGSIESELQREVCPFCDTPNCCHDCDGSTADFGDAADHGALESQIVKVEDDDVNGRIAYNGALDAIESLILAHAMAGVVVTSPAYIEGIETAIESCGNNF